MNVENIRNNTTENNPTKTDAETWFHILFGCPKRRLSEKHGSGKTRITLFIHMFQYGPFPHSDRLTPYLKAENRLQGVLSKPGKN